MSDGCGNTQACNTQACCVPAWTACSATCGGGTQSDGCGNTQACNTQVCSPWWQVKDGDVTTNNDLNSNVPTGSFFDLPGEGGYPGVAAYGGTTDLTTPNVSSKGWLVGSTATNAKTYSYAYFAGLIPDDILSLISPVDNTNASTSLSSSCTNPDTNGYCWYKYDGAANGGLPLVLSTTNIGTNKDILLVDNASLNITGNINLTDGAGFFMTVVNGSIAVDPTVGGGSSPNLEGLYFADGTLSTGIANSQLWLRGMVASVGGMDLQRNLSDNSNPSELFEFAPDQIMLYPKTLGSRAMNWKEVAP
jgi:hypothetical protein